MSNNNILVSASLAAVLVTLPLPSKAEQGDLTYSVGLGYTQTPSGIDSFAADEVRVYDASMPGTTDFVAINHHLPLLTVGLEYRLGPQVAAVLQISGMSSHLVGGLEDNRTVHAKTEAFDFGDTDQKWTQFLNVYARVNLAARVYNSKESGRFRYFSQGGGTGAYMNADSEFSFHVHAASYKGSTWDDLNAADAFRDMVSTAHIEGVNFGPTVGLGVIIPLGSVDLEVLAEAMFYLGKVGVDIDTRYPGANPKYDSSEKRTVEADNSGFVPALQLKVMWP